MLDHINNILPFLQGYSKHLNKTENFIDKDWLLLGEESNSDGYKFLSDHRVILSKVSNGIYQPTIEGTWKLLTSDRLLINKPEPLVLEEAFLEDEVLIFKESSNTDTPFSLYNPKVITDGDIETYLKNYLEIKEAIQITGTTEFDELGRKIYRNAFGSLFTGTLSAPYDNSLTLKLKDGIEVGRFYTKQYNTDKGVIIIKQATAFPMTKDKVFFNGRSELADGIYNFYTNEYDVKSMEVVNGIIKKKWSKMMFFDK